MIKTKNTKIEIANRMDQRLKSVYSAIAICLSYDYDSYFVAGNSCNAAAPHDFDIYPSGGHIFDFDGIKSRIESVGGYVAIETRNALTVNISGKVIQFCNYRKPDLVSLINSFDFAHIQIGVAVDIKWRPGDFEDDRGGYDYSTVSYVEFTDDWRKAHLLETTWYTGSEYPLSSLLRTTKYFQRGAYANKYEYKKDILNILNDIISRGYKDYKDYKDQLAAVDLLLLEPEEKEATWNLWKTCGGRGLVKTLTLAGRRNMITLTDELKRFIALWEQAVCEIRAENKASENNARIAHLCDKLESSMVAYAKGNVEYAHFAI